MRAAGKDATVVISEPIPVTLDYALEYVADDELVEVRMCLIHSGAHPCFMLSIGPAVHAACEQTKSALDGSFPRAG